jgi:dTDP-glucose pyrophosphorylase
MQKHQINEAKLTALTVVADGSIRDVMECIDRNGQGIALVLGPDRELIATISDGDIRRAILAGKNLDLPLTEILKNRQSATPITASSDTDDSILLHTMNETGVRQIPIVDESGRVFDVALLSELVKEFELPLRAVVMAGGLGMRLRPLTDDLPKPMLPIGSRPLLELIVEQLKKAGIRRVNLATHFKGEVISNHFGNGQDFGVEINYVKEDQPLGTAGALSLIEDSEEPLLVINGDILTRLDFGAMLNFHREQQAELTVAVRQYEFTVPYGVVDTNGVDVMGISEKPSIRQFINAGIYLLNPSVTRLIPQGQPFEIPELIERLIADKRPVVCFPIREYWLDIGKADQYDQAKSDFASGRY